MISRNSSVERTGVLVCTPFPRLLAGLQSDHLGSRRLARGETPLPLPLLQRVRSFYGCFLYALTRIFCSFSDLIACFLASTLAHTRRRF